MDASQLQAAGFSPDEVAEYQKLQVAGFSPAEIKHYYDIKKAPVSPNEARGTYPTTPEALQESYQSQWGSPGLTKTPVNKPTLSNRPEDYFPNTGEPTAADLTKTAPAAPSMERPGEHVLTPLEQIMYSSNPAGREDLVAHAMAGGLQPDTAAGMVAGATRPLKAVATIGKGAAERQASRLMGVSPNSPEVGTVMEHGFNPTTGNLQGQVTSAQKELWPEIENMIRTAGPVNTHDALQALQDLHSQLQRLGPAAAGQADQAGAYLQMLQEGYPKSIPAPLAQDIKQFLNQAITTFDKSLVKTEAMSGLAGGQRAFQGGLKSAIENATSDPEKLAALNKEYGNLSELFSPSAATKGKPMPAEMADINIAKMSPVGLPSWVPGATRSNVLIEKAAWPMNKALSKVGTWGETPTSLEGMLGLREPVITPNATGPMQGPKNAPLGLPEPSIPVAEGSTAPGAIAPTYAPDYGVKAMGMGKPQLPAPAGALGSPKMTGTPSGATLTPQDIATIQGIAQKDPEAFDEITRMLRTNEQIGTMHNPATQEALVPESNVGGKIPVSPKYGPGAMNINEPMPSALEQFMKEGEKNAEFRDVNTLAKEGKIPNLPVSTELKDPALTLKENGLEVHGVTPEANLPASERGKGGMYWFTDPQTGSTLAMFGKEITPEALQSKLAASRSMKWPGRQ